MRLPHEVSIKSEVGKVVVSLSKLIRIMPQTKVVYINEDSECPEVPEEPEEP